MTAKTEKPLIDGVLNEDRLRAQKVSVEKMDIRQRPHATLCRKGTWTFARRVQTQATRARKV